MRPSGHSAPTVPQWRTALHVVRVLLRKEFLQIFRDRVMVAQLLVLPIVQLLVLANAATFTVRTAQLYVVDLDHTTTSRGVVSRLVASARFHVAGTSASMARAEDALLSRRAGVILTIPTAFETALVREGRSAIQLVVNAEDGQAAGLTVGYARRIVEDYAAELGPRLRPARPGSTVGVPGEAAIPIRGVPRLDVRVRGWYNADLNYRDYMVPGILVQLVTIVGTLLTAVNIVREKEIGTLEQLNVSPLPRSAFIAGKLLPLWTIALLELSVGLLAARLLFDVPMRGSVLLVFGVASIYLVAVLGVGLWISTLVQTQQQAMLVTFFVVMIYLLMSGLFTPVHSMPRWAQWVAQANPLMHFTAVMRAILLKGAAPADVVRPVLVLSASGIVVFTLAVRQHARIMR